MDVPFKIVVCGHKKITPPGNRSTGCFLYVDQTTIEFVADNPACRLLRAMPKDMFAEVRCMYYAAHPEHCTPTTKAFDGIEVIGIEHFSRWFGFYGENGDSPIIPSQKLLEQIASSEKVVVVPRQSGSDRWYTSERGFFKNYINDILATYDDTTPDIVNFKREWNAVSESLEFFPKNMMLINYSLFKKYVDFYFDFLVRSQCLRPDIFAQRLPANVGEWIETPWMHAHFKNDDILRIDIGTHLRGLHHSWDPSPRPYISCAVDDEYCLDGVAVYCSPKGSLIRQFVASFIASGSRARLIIHERKDWNGSDRTFAEHASCAANGCVLSGNNDINSVLMAVGIRYCVFIDERVRVNFGIDKVIDDFIRSGKDIGLGIVDCGAAGYITALSLVRIPCVKLRLSSDKQWICDINNNHNCYMVPGDVCRTVSCDVMIDAVVPIVVPICQDDRSLCMCIGGDRLKYVEGIPGADIDKNASKLCIAVATHRDLIPVEPFNASPYIVVHNRKLGEGLSDRASFIVKHIYMFDESALWYYLTHEEEFSLAPRYFGRCNYVGLCHYRRFFEFSPGSHVPTGDLYSLLCNDICVVTSDVWFRSGVFDHIHKWLRRLGSCPSDFLDADMRKSFDSWLSARHDAPAKNMAILPFDVARSYSEFFVDLVMRIRKYYTQLSDESFNRYAGYLSEMLLPWYLSYNHHACKQLPIREYGKDYAEGASAIYVVAYIRHRFLRQWLQLYVHSGSTSPLLLFANEDWNDTDYELANDAVRRIGGYVLCIPEAIVKKLPKLVRGNSNFCKYGERIAVNFGLKLYIYQEASKLCPSGFLWLDDDVEVTKPISIILDMSERITDSGRRQCICTRTSKWGRRRFGQFGAVLFYPRAYALLDKVIRSAERGEVMLDDEIGFKQYADKYPGRQIYDQTLFWDKTTGCKYLVQDTSWYPEGEVRIRDASTEVEKYVVTHWYCIPKDEVEQILTRRADIASQKLLAGKNVGPVDARKEN